MRCIAATVQGRAVVVVLLGTDTDLASPDRARTALDGCLRPGTRAVILDLSRVTFLDCSVMNVLAAFGDRCADAEAQLILAGIPPPVHRLLMTLDLYRAFTIVPGMWEATRLAGNPADAPARPVPDRASGVRFS